MTDNYHTEEDAPSVEHKTDGYQLYYEEVDPCRYQLTVNGSGKIPITPKELNSQSKFREWHWDHHIKPPPRMTGRGEFEQFSNKLFDNSIKLQEPLPFRQTDAGCIQALETYLSIHVPNMVRMRGQEFLNGKTGDYVRMKLDTGRFYFKWLSLHRFCCGTLNMRQAELDALTAFIDKRGGYHGESEGRGWFRCAYHVPFDVIDEGTRAKWFDPDAPEDASN